MRAGAAAARLCPATGMGAQTGAAACVGLRASGRGVVGGKRGPSAGRLRPAAGLVAQTPKAGEDEGLLAGSSGVVTGTTGASDKRLRGVAGAGAQAANGERERLRADSTGVTAGPSGAGSCTRGTRREAIGPAHTATGGTDTARGMGGMDIERDKGLHGPAATVLVGGVLAGTCGVAGPMLACNCWTQRSASAALRHSTTMCPVATAAAADATCALSRKLHRTSKTAG